MEGFPIGEDEDIINLSDPPYYTACPNPWLNDFIDEWEKEKIELEKQGKRKADFEVDEPYASDISEGKNNPIYNAHSYHTKVPHPAIMRYILHYTQPGDIVFDGFAGTGMTGVAASMCENPDAELKYKIEQEFKVNRIQQPNWGKRNAINGDLSPIASFISKNYNTKHNLQSFITKTKKVLDEIEDEYGFLYEVKDATTGVKCKINNIIWSDVFGCPECNSEIIFYEVAVDEENGKVHKSFRCPSCGIEHTKKSVEKIWVTRFDNFLNETIKTIKKVPVRIEYSINRSKQRIRIPDEESEKIDRIESEFVDFILPTDRMPEGNESRRNDRQGIMHVHQFFTIRTLFILNELYKKSFSCSFKLLLNAQLANISYLNRHRPGVSFPYNPLSGTLYIGSQISEPNIFTAYRNKLKRLAAAFSLIKNYQIVYTGSATEQYVENNSVDYIFTDPPFGANINYSELNFISEAFIKVKTNYDVEAIENKGRGVSLLMYQGLMSESFNNYYRILKPGKWMTVEFSNTSAAVWNGIQTAIQSAGFIIGNLASIDKKQGSFKAVTTVTAVKQDLVISCYKPSSEFDKKFQNNKGSDKGIWDFIEEHLHHLPIHIVKENATTAIIERSPKILFDRLIAFYVQRSLPVPIDAGAFQKALRERFIERDGMFFTQVQVAEYDKKKAEAPEFIQASIFVASEQDGVMWLKNELSTAQTYQDIQPKWMQALASVRKGDMLPELMQILEENFLKDQEGRWYLPDPENEADLEKLRNKRLLKLFESYTQEAQSSRTKKIKEVRVEALRAGFKYCYQQKDFKTIVQVGDKIPNNLLMEDEVLLQFYDIASSRV